MSAPLVEVWTGGNNGVTLRNSLVVRPFTLITGSWSTLRVGILLGSTTGSGAAPSGTPRFAFGICSGSSNVFGDAICGHFLGYRSNDGAWTYTSASATISFGHSTGQYIRRSSGSSDVVSLDPISSTWDITGNTISASISKGMGAAYLDFAKSTNGLGYTCSISYPSIGAVAAGGMHNIGVFLREMQSGTPTFSATEGTNTAGTSFGVRVDESLSGSFDSVNVAWDRESPSLNLILYAIAVGVLV